METKTPPSSSSSPSRPSHPTTFDDPESAQSKDSVSLLMPDFSPEYQSFNEHDDLAYLSTSQEKLCPDADMARNSAALEKPTTTSGTRSYHDFPNRRWKKYDAPASYGRDSEKKSRWYSGRRNKAACCRLAQWVAMACLFAGVLGFCLYVNAKVENLRNDRDSVSWPKGKDGEGELTGLMQSRGGDAEGRGQQGDAQKEYDEKIMQALLRILERHPHHITRESTRRRRKRQSQSNDIYAMEDHEVMSFDDRIISLIEWYQHEVPKIHLRGATNVPSSYNGPYFLWQTNDDSFTIKGVRPQYNQSGLISGIEIVDQGIYLVYSQVIVNGRDDYTARHDCSPETVAILYPADGDFDAVPASEVQVLMSGYVTQDNRGMRYNDTKNTYTHPRDASVQIGLFRLQHQSQVRVRIPTHDDDCRSLRFPAGSESSSYFGLYLIAPL